MDNTYTASMLIEKLRQMIAEHGDLPVYAADAETRWRLPIGVMYADADAVESLPDRIEIKTCATKEIQRPRCQASPA